MKNLKELVEIQKVKGGVIIPATDCTAKLRIEAKTAGRYAEDTYGTGHVLLTAEGAPQVKATYVELTCMFCGQRFKNANRIEGNKILLKHTAECKAHPMRKLEADIRQLRQAAWNLIDTGTLKGLIEYKAGLDGLKSLSEDQANALELTQALIDSDKDGPRGKQYAYVHVGDIKSSVLCDASETDDVIRRVLDTIEGIDKISIYDVDENGVMILNREADLPARGKA